MKVPKFRLLTDENIDPEVVAYLRQCGFDVFDVCESGLQGTTDVVLIRCAVADNRAIITHDQDFGTLAILGGEPIVGIVFLRPGHIDAQFTIDSIKALLTVNPDVTPPFLVVVKRTGTNVTIRVRQLGA